MFFLLQKALLFPFGPRLERGLQGVKKLPRGCREGLQAALMLGGFFKGHWSPEAPSHAWGWAFRRDTRPTQPGDQPACGGWSGGHPSFLMSFVSSPRKWFSRKSQMWKSTWAETRPCRSKRAWLRFCSKRRVASLASWILPTYLERLLHVQEEGAAALFFFLPICYSILSHVWLFVTPWTTECQAPLSSIISQSLLIFMSIELMMLSNHLIFCYSLLLPSIFPSI